MTIACLGAAPRAATLPYGALMLILMLTTGSAPVAQVEVPLCFHDILGLNLRVSGLSERLCQLLVAGLEALGQLDRAWLTAKRPHSSREARS